MQDLNFQIYCYFLDAVLPVFDKANTLLQLNKPCIHILLSTLLQQLKDLLNCFVKPGDITASQKITQVQYQNIQNQKSDHSLFVGKKTRDFTEANSQSKELDLPIKVLLCCTWLLHHKVMLAILCIFHSNADCERIFSLVTNNKTEFRPNMKTETLNSLITH